MDCSNIKIHQSEIGCAIQSRQMLKIHSMTKDAKDKIKAMIVNGKPIFFSTLQNLGAQFEIKQISERHGRDMFIKGTNQKVRV